MEERRSVRKKLASSANNSLLVYSYASPRWQTFQNQPLFTNKFIWLFLLLSVFGVGLWHLQSWSITVPSIEYLIYHYFMNYAMFLTGNMQQNSWSSSCLSFVKFWSHCFAHLQILRKSGKLSNRWAVREMRQWSQKQMLTTLFIVVCSH